MVLADFHAAPISNALPADAAREAVVCWWQSELTLGGTVIQSPIEKYGAPASEMDESFVDAMRRRMAVSFHKYGKVSDAAGKVKCLPSAAARIAEYERTGNTEWLIDAANFLMMEYMHPQHPDAHYRATDSDESPGRVHTAAVIMPGASDERVSAKANIDITR